MFKLTNLKSCNMLGRLYWRRVGGFVLQARCYCELTGWYTLLSWWELHSTLKVFIIHLFGCVPFHLVNHSHFYNPTCSPLPWIHPQAPGPTPFLATTPQFNLANARPPLYKSTVIKTENIHFIRSRLVSRDQSASGLSACRKTLRPALC